MRALGLFAVLVLAGCQAASLPPAATSPAAPSTGTLALTPALTEGPYFKAGSPQRNTLTGMGIVGMPLLLTGRVLNRAGAPVAAARVDFWQADGNGAYDNAGFALRGHQFTDSQGNYKLETVMPGLYPGRTQHIHVKVQAPGKSVLTTQLFFPDVSGNASDGIFRPELVVRLQQTGNTFAAQFDFVVEA